MPSERHFVSRKAELHAFRAAMEFFARVGSDDADTRTAVRERLADEDGPVRSAAVEFFAREGFAPEEAGWILDAFEASSALTSSLVDQQLSRQMGRAASRQRSLVDELLARGPTINFHLDEALDELALETDRERRTLHPLEIDQLESRTRS